MAVFVSASDESAGQNQRSKFFMGGWLAPEKDWSDFFAPAWQERVLEGPPKIPYLHMTEIRSKQWREQYGISRLQADDRIDEAVRLIDQMYTLTPIGIEADQGYFRDELAEIKMLVASGGVKDLEPDYICFLGYAYVVLVVLHEFHPEAEKVDFIVERKSDITKHIQEFHSHLADELKLIGRKDLVPLIGELIPAGKDRIPLQAADVLCWHTMRAYTPEKMDADDIRRYRVFAAKKPSARHEMKREMVQQLKAAYLQQFPDKKVRM
jgi:hypothetical protein